MYKSFIILVFCLSFCNGGKYQGIDQTAQQTVDKKLLSSIKYPEQIMGYLVISTDLLQENNQELNIYNLDKTLFTAIKSVNGNEPSSERLMNKVYAYYPEYYVIHFQVLVSDKLFYTVKIGQEKKLIKKGDFVIFLSQEKYLLQYFCVTSEINPLRKKPSSDGSLVDEDLDYSSLNFECTEVNGDWVKVKCNIDCEGCGTLSNEIEGWIRWRKNGHIIIDQRYTC